MTTSRRTAPLRVIALWLCVILASGCTWPEKRMVTPTLTTVESPRPPVSAAATRVPSVPAYIDSSTPTVRPDSQCFRPMDLVPGKTTRDQVVALWGEPASREGLNYPIWNYGTPGQVGHASVFFEDKEHVSAVFVDLTQGECTLGDVVATLGPPEIVELLIPPTPLPGKYASTAYPLREFHYPTKGVSYQSLCPSEKVQNCSSLQPADGVGLVLYYQPMTVEKLIAGSYAGSTFVEWSGFER